MKRKNIILISISLLTIVVNAQNKSLDKRQVKEDLKFLTNTLNAKSSYVYLNGYDFNKDFENYLKSIKDSTPLEDFGLFLTRIIGKIGDRHSSVKEYDLNDSLYLPFMYASEKNKVIVLNRDSDKKLIILNSRYPYLKKIDGILIEDVLQKIVPEEITAPKEAYFRRAVGELRNVQRTYKIFNKTLHNQIQLTLTDSTSNNDTILIVAPVNKSKRLTWVEKVESQNSVAKLEGLNRIAIIEPFFNLKDNIAYILIPDMVHKEDAPLFFEKINFFMQSIKENSKTLIIDVRSNGGGNRDLMYEFAKYLIHPDSIYVINIAQQRALIPLSSELKKNLHYKNLFPFSELDTREQKAAKHFLKTFKPMYKLDAKKYSEYYFGLFNGKKLSHQSYYYKKPVYILANERSFSAASVFVSAFKGIPNIKIIGVNTDGSSGNSEKVELPNSKLNIKLSTMVSFQKDGRILDGIGTEPDIKIERDLNQVLWKSDTQLEKLKDLISSQK